MAYASTVPAVITKLLAAFTGAAGLAGVEVRDGEQPPDTSATEAVYVGYTGRSGEDAVSYQAIPDGLPGSPDRERYTVHCAAMVLNTDSDVAAARARACILRDAAVAAVKADPQLGQTVMRAAPGSGALRQAVVRGGVTATVPFDVDVDAYTSR